MHKCSIKFIKNISIIKHLWSSVWLVGNRSASSGNVYGFNPVTNRYGPVCDDGWDIRDVISLHLSVYNVHIHSSGKRNYKGNGSVLQLNQSNHFAKIYMSFNWPTWVEHVHTELNLSLKMSKVNMSWLTTPLSALPPGLSVR